MWGSGAPASQASRAPWLLALAAGTAAAGGDVLARALRISHVGPTALAALLFFAVGYATRRGARLSAYAAGSATHALLDAAWLAHALGVQAGLAVAALNAALDLAVDVLAASAGARTGTGTRSSRG